MNLRQLAENLKPLDAGDSATDTGPQRPPEESEAARICREYQQNTQRANALQTSILKGLTAGENPYKLLYMAVECIGRMTGETRVFADTARGRIMEIYGAALKQPQAAALELEEVRARLAMLERPELEQTRNLTDAIRTHRERERELLSIIQAQ